MAKTILIKKYENRRLYDATNSRYVNLDDVARILQHGDDVRVVDAATGDDITRLILTQIIVEGAKTPDSGFPLDMLREMVIASGRVSQESAIRYTKAMLDLYKSTYQAMSPAFNPFDFMQAANTANKRAAPPGEDPKQEPIPVQETNSDQAEVIMLKQRLADLERQVSTLAAEKRKSRISVPKPRRSKGK
jgi:polyhydroxyalkanoate synthesis repressor PhaR